MKTYDEPWTSLGADVLSRFSRPCALARGDFVMSDTAIAERIAECVSGCVGIEEPKYVAGILDECAQLCNEVVMAFTKEGKWTPRD